MFAHDSQVFCEQRLGRKVSSCFSLVQPPPDSTRNLTVCGGKAGGELRLRKIKKKSKLVVKFLIPGGIKQGAWGKCHRECCKRKYLLSSVFLSLETSELAANSFMDGWAACLQTELVYEAHDPWGRSLSFPPTSLLRASGELPLLPTSLLCGPTPSLPCPLHSSRGGNDKFCPFSRLQWDTESWIHFICIAFLKCNNCHFFA